MKIENLLSQQMSMMSGMHKDFMDLARQYLRDLGPGFYGAQEGSPEEEASESKYEEAEEDSHDTADICMEPEPPYYMESDIDPDDPAFLSGKPMGLPMGLSIYFTPRGAPDSLLPIRNGKYTEL